MYHVKPARVLNQSRVEITHFESVAIELVEREMSSEHGVDRSWVDKNRKVGIETMGAYLQLGGVILSQD